MRLGRLQKFAKDRKRIIENDCTKLVQNVLKPFVVSVIPKMFIIIYKYQQHKHFLH